MNRMSARQRAVFAALGVKYPTSTFKPAGQETAVSRQVKRPKDTGPDEATVTAVLERDGWKCASCGDELYGRRGVEYSIHHRKRRSQGGDNRLSNLVALCGHGTSLCHGSVHSEIVQARLFGFLLRSSEDPEQVPVEHSWRGRVCLTDDGGVVVIETLKEEPDEHPF